MKILIINHPWGKSWINLYVDEFVKSGCDVDVWDGEEKRSLGIPDLVLCTWGDRDYTKVFPNSKHVMMMRRFEFFHSAWRSYNWDAIDLLVTCNVWIGTQVAKELNNKPTTVICVRNSIDTNLWTYKERSHGNKIGMVCRLFPIKNLSLAAQILLALPKEYELHIAGPFQDPNITPYLISLLPASRLFLYGNLERHRLDKWWEDKNYCLSTSISEGDPMCILEAMAKGIKPVVHAWPGANEYYETFKTVGEAVDQIMIGQYNSKEYLSTVQTENSPEIITDLARHITKMIRRLENG